ncbi:MAG: preprotein translocase subunit SecG [Chlorobi bacterium]|nr:preprotein translocase subunit SecG [Chlorobiota bacterium]
MFVILMVLLVIISILLTVVILMQASKGVGLSGAFGGGGGMGAMLGVRKTSDILARTTWILAVSLIVLILIVNLFFLPRGEIRESVLERSASEVPVQQPQAPAQQPAQPPGK